MQVNATIRDATVAQCGGCTEQWKFELTDFRLMPLRQRNRRWKGVKGGKASVKCTMIANYFKAPFKRGAQRLAPVLLDVRGLGHGEGRARVMRLLHPFDFFPVLGESRY